MCLGKSQNIPKWDNDGVLDLSKAALPPCTDQLTPHCTEGHCAGPEAVGERETGPHEKDLPGSSPKAGAIGTWHC